VRVYAGVDPVSKKRHYLVDTVPAGPSAGRDAERVRTQDGVVPVNGRGRAGLTSLKNTDNRCNGPQGFLTLRKGGSTLPRLTSQEPETL
jgi:hypothetical protein